MSDHRLPQRQADDGEHADESQFLGDDGQNEIGVGTTSSGQIVGSADRLEGTIARATGGPVFAGQAYRVGEAGPEMFVPSDSGRVLSPAQVQQLANQALAGPAAGGGEQVLVVNLHLDGKQVDQALVRPAELRRRAGS